jgi:hypothetical protein
MSFDIKKYVHAKVAAVPLPPAVNSTINMLTPGAKVMGGLLGYGKPAAPAATVTPPAPAPIAKIPQLPAGTPAPAPTGPTTVAPPATPTGPGVAPVANVPAPVPAEQPKATEPAPVDPRVARRQQYANSWKALQADPAAAKAEMQRIAAIEDPVAKHQAYQGLLAMQAQLPTEQQSRMAIEADEAQRQMDAITSGYVVKGQDQYKTPEEYNAAVAQAKEMEQKFQSGSQGNMQDMLTGRLSAEGVPDALVQLAEQDPNTFADTLAKTPEQAAAFKAVMGKDAEAYQKWISTEAGNRAQSTIAALKQGKPKVGPDGQPVVGEDGKPVMEKAGFMDLLSQPGSIAMIGGLILAMFGGKPGAIIGTLLAAGGGMNLWGRYKGATDPKTAELSQKYAAAQTAAGKDPKDLSGLNDFAKASGYPEGTAGAVQDQIMLIETGMADTAMGEKAQGYVDRNINYKFAPQEQPAQ